MICYYAIIAAAAVVLFFPPAIPAAELPSSKSHQTTKTVVTTAFGKLEGRIVHLDVGGGGLGPVEQYLGIPYASPPIGQKRFMLPNSAAKWSSTKDATRLPPVCVQMFPNSVAAGSPSEALKWMPESHYRHITRLRSLFLRSQSEDCLYMNIYVPERRGDTQFPVLVLVHGGSFSWGTGNAYNASVLASYGQIIVVTLNYRLGVLGFLSAGYMAPSCRGNWALGDIAAALEFLRQTVKDFNGDRNRITLLGWDTGAALVNLLMSSPVSAPSNARSFQRAILLGGSALSSWALATNPSEVFSYVAQGLSCPPFNAPQSTKSPSQLLPHQHHQTRKPFSEDAASWQGKVESESLLQEMTDCIAAASVENMTRVARNIEPPTYLNVFGPNVDGSMVINDPKYNLEHYSDLFRGLDLMVGLTKSEALHLLANRDVKEGVERKKRDQIYRTLVTNLFRYHRNEIMSAVEDEYTEWQSPAMHQGGNIRKAVLQALSDGLYVAPAISLARLHSRPKEPFSPEIGPFASDQAAADSKSNAQSANRKGTTFAYVFGGHEGADFERGNLPDSVHNEDLAYILGYPLMERAQLDKELFNNSFTSVDKTLSEAMMRYVANFVKSGDPNRPRPFRSQFGDAAIAERMAKLDWPKFESDMRESYIEIGENPLRDSFYRAHEVAFWNKFLPSLERAGQMEANERHHQFPTNSTYFGIVRRFDRYPPFVPPPLPPTPMPPALQAKLQEEKIKNQQQAGASSTASPFTPSSQPVAQENYSTILSVTVAVGCALLTLNILIFAGIYHQWDKHKRFRKRTDNNNHQHQYPHQSTTLHQQQHQHHFDVDSGNGGGLFPVQGINASVLNFSNAGGGHHQQNPASSSMIPGMYDLSSTPLTRQPRNVGGTANVSTSIGGRASSSNVPPAPPPPISGTNGLDNDLHPTFTSSLSSSSKPSYHLHHLHPPQMQQHQPQHSNLGGTLDTTPGTPHGAVGGTYAEQEPLLNRSFVSPTCPRHGKQAAAAAAAAAAAMEEIQV